MWWILREEVLKCLLKLKRSLNYNILNEISTYMLTNISKGDKKEKQTLTNCQKETLE